MPVPNLDEVTAQRRRTMLIAGVLSLVVVLVGVGVGLALLAHKPVAKKPPLTPAEETSAAVSIVPTLSPSDTPTASLTPTAAPITTTPSITTSSAGQIVRSGRIAWRRNGEIWVSNEDGSAAKKVVDSTAGSFSLSPDGRTLVLATGSTYLLVDTVSSAPLPFGGPIDLPVWAPDSSWLAYSSKTTTGTYTVRRITRSGTGDALVVNGASRPQIAPDGHRIAVSLSIDPGASDALRVYDTTAKTMKTVPNSAGAVSYAWAPGGTLYFAKDRKGTVAGTLSVTDKAITRSTTIVSLPVTDPPSIPGALIPSPDGTKVLFAMTGDDGYSRMQVADSATKKLKAITTPRYDAYPRSWLLDGTALLYIEGNALGTDPIALYSIHPDGTKRVKIVDTPKL